MKKIKIVKWVGIVLFLVYITMLIADLTFHVLGDWQILVFSLILALISLNLIAKGVIIKSSSTMWFALTLILFAIGIAIFELNSIDAIDYYFVFSLIPIISSVINLAIFKKLIYIKVIIINISIILPIIIRYFLKIEIAWVVAITVVSILIGIIVCRCINLNKENE